MEVNIIQDTAACGVVPNHCLRKLKIGLGVGGFGIDGVAARLLRDAIHNPVAVRVNKLIKKLLTR
jgi:hypothetical protein